MSALLVTSDNGRVVLDITQDDTGATSAHCRACGQDITDRGHFTDTVQAASIHADSEEHS